MLTLHCFNCPEEITISRDRGDLTGIRYDLEKQGWRVGSNIQACPDEDCQKAADEWPKGSLPSA